METKIHELNNFKNKVVSKTIKKLGKVLMGAFIVIAGFSSCEKSDLKPDYSGTELKESTHIVAPTTWRIASFQWQNRANNDHFEEYVFRFNVDKSITAIHRDIEEQGKWMRRGNTLKIEFRTSPLYELSNYWTIVEHTTSKLVLKGLNQHNHTSELVEFEKVNFLDAN